MNNVTRRNHLSIFCILTIMILMASKGFAGEDVKITFEYSSPPPMVMNVGDTNFVRFDVHFSSSDFDTLFLHIPDKPEFFTFWRERKFVGPADYIYDKIVFKPGDKDGGQYVFTVIAGGIRANGEVVADSLTYELRVKPFIFDEPEFTGGTSNTIRWMRGNRLYDQWIYIFDPGNPAKPGNPAGLGKPSSSGIIHTTFENLQHEVRYGFFIKGYTPDSTVAYSDTVYSTQDALPPEFLSSSYGRPAPKRTVDLFWYPVSDQTSYVKGYTVFRRKAGTGFVAIDSVYTRGTHPPNPPEFTNLGDFYNYHDSPGDLIEGERYFYKIVALDAGLNLGDGQEIGPFIPDETPPEAPVFDWQPGNGFEYVIDKPIKNLPDMGYTEKTWFKKGVNNTVHVFNPVFQSGFEGLASADSVRFQSVRDSSKFFFDEWQPGMQFFEIWTSGWLPIDDFSGQTVFYNFDFTSGGENDNWFVHGHFYKFRAQFKDKAGNVGEWSRKNPAGLLVGAYQDAFPPGDINSLDLFVKFDPAYEGGGYFRIDWQAARDSVSGVGKYHIYRKIGSENEFVLIDSIPAADTLLQQYVDPFGSIGRRAQTYYRVIPVDNVDNKRGLNDTNWEVYEWPPLPPELKFEEQFLRIGGKSYTSESKTGVNWAGFDSQDVDEFYIYINSDSQLVDPSAMQYEVPLHEGENHISARALFSNGVWSPKSNVLTVYRDSTPPSQLPGLTVKNDTSYTGNIFLQWSPSQDVLPVHYNVYRKEKGATDFQLLGSTLETAWTDLYQKPDGSILKAFQYYEYKVLPEDTLGNAVTANAGFGETYCNIAPEIERFSFFDDSLSVFWSFPSYPDSSVVPMDSIRFDVYLFRGDLPSVISLKDAYQVEYVVGKNDITFKIEPGLTYFSLVRAVELRSSQLDSTAWSKPKISDTGKSIIPPVDSLLTLAQPTDTTGIFVSWELYWKQAFWNNNPNDLVGFVKVLRWKANNPDSVTSRKYGPNDPEFQNNGFMDRMDLEPGINYVYQAIPYEQKPNDPPRFLPAGNQDAKTVNDTSVVINYTDRVFIPKLNHLYTRNPETGKKYFKFLNADDSLRFEWFWLYKTNNTEKIANPGDFRGAKQVKLFVSNNPDFDHQPDFKKFTKTVTLDRAQLKNDSLFYFTYISDITDPNTFNIYEGKSLYAKIIGFDRWGNSPDYPSSAGFDGVTELILDNTPPTKSDLSFRAQSSADTLSGIPMVDVYFYWNPSQDNISGLRNYTITISQTTDSGDSLIQTISNIPPSDTTYVLQRFEIKDDYFENPLVFRLFPRDYAGNINRESVETEFTFFEPPEITFGDSISVNHVRLKWTKVPAADKYLIVFAIKKKYFADPTLRLNPGNREEVSAKPSDPDTIEYVLSKQFDLDTTWYFRMTAIKSDIYESGWSNFYFLPAFFQNGDEYPVTHVEDEDELPTKFALSQNYPNPFNEGTMIHYAIPQAAHIKITIYNLKGEKVRTLVDKGHQPGHFQVRWDGRNDYGNTAASGVYLYEIRGSNYHQIRKCLFIK